MNHLSPRMYKYKKQGVILTIGIDNNGRLYSSYEKAGKVVAQDMFMKMPSEAILAKQGWERHYE